MPEDGITWLCLAILPNLLTLLVVHVRNDDDDKQRRQTMKVKK